MILLTLIVKGSTGPINQPCNTFHVFPPRKKLWPHIKQTCFSLSHTNTPQEDRRSRMVFSIGSGYYQREDYYKHKILDLSLFLFDSLP
jgi:hypothetical protein